MKAKDNILLSSFAFSPVKSYHRNSMILHGRKGETETKCLRIVYADMKNGSEVIFPVTPEIQKIIDRFGNEPKLGERVFPILSKSKTPEQEGGVIQRYNKSIRKQMKKVAEILKLKQTPTSTWARHSFATNLNNAGVPREYIKSSMAHSTSNDVTSKYIGAYPLPKMQEYNSYLLKVPQTVNSTEDLLKILKGMGEEERAALLAEVSK